MSMALRMLIAYIVNLPTKGEGGGQKSWLRCLWTGPQDTYRKSYGICKHEQFIKMERNEILIKS